MENNFDKEFYGAQPQKPFTEKSDYSQNRQENAFVKPQDFAARQETSNQQSFGFNPERPLIHQPTGQSQANSNPQSEQSYPNQEKFNPVENTAVYQNGEFSKMNEAQVFQGRDSAQHAQYVPEYHHNYQEYNQQPSQNIRPVSYSYQYNNQNSYAQPKPSNQKSNKGLIAVIIVLSVLLAGSLFGIFGYLLFTAGNNGGGAQEQGLGGFVPNITIPDYTDPYNQIATQPAVSHDESDYSDKIVKDYGGMSLEKKPSDADKNADYGSQYAYERVSDSVVGIMCYKDKDNTVLSSQGSGIIISKDGYVITNSHVIGDSKTAYGIKIISANGDEYKAGVVGFDSRTDIAVLKMDGAKDLKPATFGDSSELNLGEDIIIVGNPGGINYQNSMTKGIVSALDRDASKKSIVKYIQTDAAINPGNSGGPAVNMFGQVVGIASSKIAGVTYEGMAFCIPSDTAKTIVDSLVRNGYVEGRVKIGITGTAVDSNQAAYYSIPLGIIVDTVDPDGPCGKTGLKSDDIITNLDGEQVTSFADIFSILEKHSEGDKVILKYYSYQTGEYKEEEITLVSDK